MATNTKSKRKPGTRQAPDRDQRRALAERVAAQVAPGASIQEIRDAATKIAARAPKKFDGVQGYGVTQRFIKLVREQHEAGS